MGTISIPYARSADGMTVVCLRSQFVSKERKAVIIWDYELIVVLPSQQKWSGGNEKCMDKI